MVTALLLILTGLFVGVFGTLIGVGGGFIMVPVLLFMYPEAPPEVLTSISLAVIFMNSVSGAIAQARNKRIEYRMGLTLALTAIPGTILGAMLVSMVPREYFEPVFGLLLILAGAFIFFKPLKKQASETNLSVAHKKYNLWIIGIFSMAVGTIASFVGIGGGIIHVPVLIHVFQFPVPAATATSQFVLAIMSLVGTGVHLFEGTLQPHLDKVIYLGVPAILGAQIGAALSKKIKDIWIVRSLALVLVVLGIRLLAVLLR